MIDTFIEDIRKYAAVIWFLWPRKMDGSYKTTEIKE